MQSVLEIRGKQVVRTIANTATRTKTYSSVMAMALMLMGMMFF